MQRVLVLLIVLAALSALPARAQDDLPTLADVIAALPDEELGIAYDLSRELFMADDAIMALLADPDAQFTVLVPSNEALTEYAADQLDITDLNRLILRDEVRARVLRQHIIPTVIDEAWLENATFAFNDGGAIAGTIEPGAYTHITHGFIDPEQIYFDNGPIFAQPMMASNGILYRVGRALDGRFDRSELGVAPPEGEADMISILEAEGEFTTLLRGIEASGRDERIARYPYFTLFAVMDEDFAYWAERVPSFGEQIAEPEGLGEYVQFLFMPGLFTDERLQTIAARYGRIRLAGHTGFASLMYDDHTGVTVMYRPIVETFYATGIVIHVLDDLPPMG